VKYPTKLMTVGALLFTCVSTLFPSNGFSGTDPSRQTSKAAQSETLEAPKNSSGEIEKDVVAALIAALDDEDSRVRLHAVRSIQSVGAGGTEAQEALIELVKSDDSAEVRVAAIDAIRSMTADQKASNQAIADLAIKGKHPDVRKAAISALAEQPDSKDNVRILIRALKDTDPTVRATAAEALGDVTAQRSTVRRNTASALDGYCPVTLLDAERWVRGNPKWSYTYRGIRYQFSSQSNRQTFIDDPARYVAVRNGQDVVLSLDKSKEVPGHRSHGVVYQSRLYLFANEDSLETFWENPSRYVAE